MICAFYGKCVPQQHIKDGLSISRIGVTMRDLKQRSEELGFDAVVAESRSAQLQKIPFPIILHWNANHFVVLYRVTADRRGNCYFHIADPSNGKMTFTRDEFERCWYVAGKEYGRALIVKPTQHFYLAEFPKQRNDWTLAKRLIWKYVPSWRKIGSSVALMAVSMGCGWMVPFIYQSIIDSGVALKNEPVVVRLFLVQLSFFIGYVISSSFSSYMLSRVNLHVGLEYVGELLDKLMRLPMKYFDTRLNTEFIQRLDDFGRIRSFLVDNLISIFYYLANAVVYFVLLAYYSCAATAIFIALSLVVMLWDLHFVHERKFLDYSLFTENARNRNLLYEIVGNMPDIKANVAQSAEKEKWERNQKHINDLMLRQMTLNYKQNVGRSTINRLRDIVIICFCCVLTIHGDLSMGILMSISYILGQLGGPVEQIQSLVTQYQMFKVSLSRLSEVQRKEEEMVQGENCRGSLSDGIRVSDVWFKYEGSFSPNVFEGLSAFFPANKATAIVGNSGSGKTTLIKLILGFYFPQQGGVEIDGMSLASMSVDSWRRQCGVVLQDGRVFSGTIMENIALGDSAPDEERVRHAAKLACIDEFIEKQPGQYGMRIGSTGIELSQGQKQRILIARTIYKDPQLLIFDEATSSLDTINERKIMDNLKEFFKGRTVIVVAHRLSTVVNADNIIFLEKGKIAEQGTHGELVAKKGKYYELIKNQLELES